jgi:3-mercaptopyruvate sulfurtransferase SseA
MSHPAMTVLNRSPSRPVSTLILWQDLFADQNTQKFKSPEQIRVLLEKAGVKPNQDVVTYCAVVGMRASLMFWAAHSAGCRRGCTSGRGRTGAPILPIRS